MSFTVKQIEEAMKAQQQASVGAHVGLWSSPIHAVCPKCGEVARGPTFHDGKPRWWVRLNFGGCRGTHEHLHWGCRTCGANWKTPTYEQEQSRGKP